MVDALWQPLLRITQAALPVKAAEQNLAVDALGDVLGKRGLAGAGIAEQAEDRRTPARHSLEPVRSRAQRGVLMRSEDGHGRSGGGFPDIEQNGNESQRDPRQRGAHSGLMPACFTTAPQRACSSRMKAPKSSGVPLLISAPWSARLLRTSGMSRILTSSALSSRTIGRGVSAGPEMPYQSDTSMRG